MLSPSLYMVFCLLQGSFYLLCLGLKEQPASWAFAEQDVANRGTEASSVLERSPCSLVKGDEED